MLTRLLLALCLLSACTLARVRTPDGTTLTGIAVGHAKAEVCVDPPPPPPWLYPVPASVHRCAVIEGGALSNNAMEAIGTFLTAVGTAFAVWWTGVPVP